MSMVVTDLDGTLLNNHQEVSREDFSTLVELGKRGIPRIVATGRSLFSVSKVLPDDFPIDYIVFSSGAGCMDWKNRNLLFRHSLSRRDITEIFRVLSEYEVDFSIHHPVPDNHHFIYFRNNGSNPDFQRRIQYYESYGREGGDSCPSMDEACQFLVVQQAAVPAVEAPLTREMLSELLPEHNVIRTTSPIDGQTEWIEIFPALVSKAKGGDYLRREVFPDTETVLAVGNDYNDLQLLRWADISYVVDNAPPGLKKEFFSVPSNNDSGFSAAVSAYLKR